MKTSQLCALSALVVAAAVMGGCKARLNGTMNINGATFQPTACRSGEAFGFVGVELSDASGARLRLASTPSMQPMVYYFAPGSPMPMPVGVCGTMSITRTNTRINNIYNIEGSVSLSCTGPAGNVFGAVTFANCH